MTKNIRNIIYIIIVTLICFVIVLSFLFSHKENTTKSNSHTGITVQPTSPPANSPERVTQTYYNWYDNCVKQHPNALTNANNLKQYCPMHAHEGISTNFIQRNELKYTDQVLCDEGIPLKMIIGKSY